MAAAVAWVAKRTSEGFNAITRYCIQNKAVGGRGQAVAPSQLSALRAGVPMQASADPSAVPSSDAAAPTLAAALLSVAPSPVAVARSQPMLQCKAIFTTINDCDSMRFLTHFKHKHEHANALTLTQAHALTPTLTLTCCRCTMACSCYSASCC